MDGRVIYQLIVQRNSDISVWAQAVAEGKQPPFVFYVKKSHEAMRTKEAVIGEATIWDLVCVTTSYAATSVLAGRVKTSFTNIDGTTITWTEGSTPVTQRLDAVSIIDENDEYDEDSGLYAKILSVKILIIY